jgi:hypothetical protein
MHDRARGRRAGASGRIAVGTEAVAAETEYRGRSRGPSLCLILLMVLGEAIVGGLTLRV